FNEQLDKLIKGTLPKGHIFQLGNAGAILKASGIEELPIELSADRTKEKSEQPNHPFDLNDLKNLTKAVQNPIAVFDSTKKDGSKIILTELKDKKGNNYVVALRVSNKGAGRLNVEINDVKSVYPKDHTQGVLDWINSEGNLLRYADKEKALNYISVQSTNLIGNGNTEKGSNTKIQHKLNNAVEKIKNFKNPISDKEVDDVRFSVNKNYIGEALYIINKNAKKLRDLKRDLYNFQKYGDVTSGLAERAGVSEFNFSEEKNSLVVYEENGKAYYDIKDIEDAIKNQEREVSFIENNDNYDEDELDFEKSYLNSLESIKETFENNIEKIKGVYMFDLSNELNRLYEFKGKVISKIGGKAIGVHVFPKGDVRELYKIGDFVFHGEDVSDDYTKEEILKLDKLGEISSDIKIDNIKSLEDAISEIEKKLGIQFMQYPDGTIYGAVLPDGTMYFNPEHLNANTPIHEHTHLFNQVIQQTNPKLWNRMVEAVKGIGLWNEVKNDPNYKNLKTDSQIADEVYSRLTGNKGEVNWQERIAKADSKSRLAKVGELIKEYWNNVMDILGIKKMSADDFANMTLDKLFSG
ncbi:MAG TPA: hypothetical protein PKL30_26675, partial [Leptospiraceae bacterium]|nr:hypothetical protein [Leptospiraceae bacterium]